MRKWCPSQMRSGGGGGGGGGTLIVINGVSSE